MGKEKKIIVALDVSTITHALNLVEVLQPYVYGFKIGMQLFTAAGPGVVRTIIRHGGKVFLDLKYHDIPNTVAGASSVATALGVKMFNVHCLGGIPMMEAASKTARETAEKLKIELPLVLGVTILTSHDYDSLLRIGLVKDWRQVSNSVNWTDEQFRLFKESQVQSCIVGFARDAETAGLDGVIASPIEVKAIRSACGPNFKIVTPGIRPLASAMGDQMRVGTPEQAVRDGADWLVIGRPITEAEDKIVAVNSINAEIARAEEEGVCPQ